MFTPLQTYMGGLLLHVASSSLLTETGRVLGISGVVDGAVFGDRARWRWALLAGLALGPPVLKLANLACLPDPGLGAWAALSFARLAAAGFLVGLGAKLGSGCTSGHFLCGVARLSPRSIVATATFFATAVLTAYALPAPLADPVLPAYTYVAAPGHEIRWILPWFVGALALHVVAKRLVRASFSVPARRELPYLVSGLTFSLGLCVSGMVSPLKVLGFLRLAPLAAPWPPAGFDPSLALIVVGGVIPNAFAYRGTPHKANLVWETWRVPDRRDIDGRLLGGAALFGFGWGFAGVCPGPALVSLSSLLVSGAADARAYAGWAVYAGNLLLGLGAGHLV